MLTESMEETEELCTARLQEPDLRGVAEAIEHAGVSIEHCVSLVRSASESAAGKRPVLELRALLERSGAGCEKGSLERFLLIHGALSTADSIPSLPVCESVKVLLCEAFQSMTHPSDDRPTRFSADHSHFVGMCKIATLRRFPAGEFDWELSGIPRSWLLKLDPRSLLRVSYLLARHMPGFGPVFFRHMGLRRGRGPLTRLESDRAYYRMAMSMELQPQIKGFAASAWYTSPDTHKVSPRLAWVNDTFLENGGIVVKMGPADPNCGVFSRGGTRKRLYEAGQFKPTLGLAIWPRKQMLAWAAAHPVYAEGHA